MGEWGHHVRYDHVCDHGLDELQEIRGTVRKVRMLEVEEAEMSGFPSYRCTILSEPPVEVDGEGNYVRNGLESDQFRRNLSWH